MRTLIGPLIRTIATTIESAAECVHASTSAKHWAVSFVVSREMESSSIAKG